MTYVLALGVWHGINTDDTHVVQSGIHATVR